MKKYSKAHYSFFNSIMFYIIWRMNLELNKMQDEYRTNSVKYFEHAEKLHAADGVIHDKMDSRLDDLEKAKSKITMYIMITLAFAAGTGWLNSVSFPHILKFLGL